MKTSSSKTIRIQCIRIFLFALFTTATIIQPVDVMAQAQQPEVNRKAIEELYNLNKITLSSQFAKPCGVGSIEEGKIELVGGDVPEKVWNFLIAKGMGEKQAAGIMGNIQAESGFKIDAIEKGSGAGFGLVQWTGNRRVAFEAAAGALKADLGFQLEYLYKEANERRADRPEYRQYGNEWEAVRAQPTIEDALVAFHHEFEISHLMDRANPRQAVIDERGGFANEWYTKFTGKAPGKAADAADCNDINTGQLNKALLQYAWPIYRDLPEYSVAEQRIAIEGWQKVIDTYPGQGKYIGGLSYPGIDCGGFVTHLIIDSGFDPGYNYGGLIKNGAGYTVTQQKWLDANWTNLTKDVFKGKTDPAQLQAGDVAVSPVHTFVFVGQVPGFDSTLASASLDDRAPMADTAQNPADGSFTWYRKK